LSHHATPSGRIRGRRLRRAGSPQSYNCNGRNFGSHAQGLLSLRLRVSQRAVALCSIAVAVCRRATAIRSFAAVRDAELAGVIERRFFPAHCEPAVSGGAPGTLIGPDKPAGSGDHYLSPRLGASRSRITVGLGCLWPTLGRKTKAPTPTELPDAYHFSSRTLNCYAQANSTLNPLPLGSARIDLRQ
jgi:hypothetical protein